MTFWTCAKVILWFLAMYQVNDMALFEVGQPSAI